MGGNKLISGLPWYLFKQWEDHVAGEYTNNRSLIGGCRLSYETGTGVYVDVFGRKWIAIECINIDTPLPEEKRQEAAYVHISLVRQIHNCTVSHPLLGNKLDCSLHSATDTDIKGLHLTTLLFRVSGVVEGVGGC